MIGAGIFYITAKVGNFICNFNNTAFPGIRLNKARSFYGVEVYSLLAGLNSLLVNFSAVTDKTVAYCIGKVERLFKAVRVGESLNKISKEKTVAFMPELFRCVVTFFLL